MCLCTQQGIGQCSFISSGQILPAVFKRTHHIATSNLGEITATLFNKVRVTLQRLECTTHGIRVGHITQDLSSPSVSRVRVTHITHLTNSCSQAIQVTLRSDTGDGTGSTNDTERVLTDQLRVSGNVCSIPDFITQFLTHVTDVGECLLQSTSRFITVLQLDFHELLSQQLSFLAYQLTFVGTGKLAGGPVNCMVKEASRFLKRGYSFRRISDVGSKAHQVTGFLMAQSHCHKLRQVTVLSRLGCFQFKEVIPLSLSSSFFSRGSSTPVAVMELFRGNLLTGIFPGLTQFTVNGSTEARGQSSRNRSLDGLDSECLLVSHMETSSQCFGSERCLTGVQGVSPDLARSIALACRYGSQVITRYLAEQFIGHVIDDSTQVSGKAGGVLFTSSSRSQRIEYLAMGVLSGCLCSTGSGSHR